MGRASLQVHTDKHAPQGLSMRVFGSGGGGDIVTPEQAAAGQCLSMACAAPATHFANALGNETLLCKMHAGRFELDRQQLPTDLWFVRALAAGPARFQLLCRRLPADHFSRLDFEWLAFNNGQFFLFSEPPSDIDASDADTAWHGVSEAQAQALLGQLGRACSAGYAPPWLGFAREHPHERPDCSLAYTVVDQLCGCCSELKPSAQPLEPQYSFGRPLDAFACFVYDAEAKELCAMGKPANEGPEEP